MEKRGGREGSNGEGERGKGRVKVGKGGGKGGREGGWEGGRTVDGRGEGGWKERERPSATQTSK